MQRYFPRRIHSARPHHHQNAARLSVNQCGEKLSPDKRNANDVTSQAIADMGGAATYYDCLVEVKLAV